MPEIATLLAFALASLVVLALPGPTMIYVVTRAAEQGRRAGLVSAAGVGLGTLAHVVAAVAGLSALLATSPTAMTLVRLAGGAYLVWLGIGRLRARSSDGAPAGVPAGRGRLLRQGVLMEALNPKTAVFFLAFLPQFADPARGSVAAQVALLGLTFVALAAVCDASCALAASAARSRLGRADVRLDRVAGAALLALGAFALAPAM